MNDPIRLPQDVGPAQMGDMRGIPDLDQLRGTVSDYAAMRERTDDHDTRALGCWGLVAQWPNSRGVVDSLLHSNRVEDVEDAAGVLCRVGVPDDCLSDVVSLIESLPDSSARDALVQTLPTAHPRRTTDASPAAIALNALAQIPLGGAWEPYTRRIQFIEASFDVVAKAFVKWMREIQPQSEVSRHTGSLGALLSLLDPYWFPTKRLLIEAQGPWTAVFSNSHDTYEAYVLSERLKVRGLATAFSVDFVHQGEVRNYGGTSLELVDRGKSVRTIHASRQESGWEFVLLGKELSFEETDRYRARVKRERFDLEMLNRYCAAVGIDRFDDAFYGPRALLHSEPPTGKTHPQYQSAAAWRAAHFSG